MAKDIVQEAVEQAEAMKEAAYENAKSVLVDAMSTNLKAAVSEAIGEKIEETGNPKGADLNVQYDPSGQEKLDGDDLTDTDGAWGDIRSCGWRVLPVFNRRTMDDPALRENAVR